MALDRYMDIGIVHFMLYPEVQKQEGIEESLVALLDDNFFSTLEITTIKDPATRDRVRALLEENGLNVGWGAQPVQLAGRLDLNSADEAERRRAIEAIKAGIDEAYEMGAGRFSLMSGPDPGDTEREAAIGRLIDSLTEICQHARLGGPMPVCIEVFDRMVDKKALIGSTADAVRVSAAVRKVDPSFGLLLDLSHLPLQFETTRAALTLAQDHLEHVHIGNCILKEGHPLYGDHHPRFGHPDGVNGVPELAEFLHVLLDVGYLKEGAVRGVTFEVKPAQGESPIAMIANAKSTLKQAWATLGR